MTTSNQDYIPQMLSHQQSQQPLIKTSQGIPDCVKLTIKINHHKLQNQYQMDPPSYFTIFFYPDIALILLKKIF